MTYTTAPPLSPPVAKTTARPSVTYTEYVKDYALLSFRFALLCFFGIALIIGAGIYLDAALMVAFVALGFGMAGGGGAGLLAASTAHSVYSRHLSIITATTYEHDTQTPRPGPRAFIPSTNAPQQIKVAGHWLTDAVWRKLYETADRDGRIKRDAAQKVLPRQLYRDWQTTLGELARLGLVDEGGYISPFGKQAYTQGLSPFPQREQGQNESASTHARRTHGGYDGI